LLQNSSLSVLKLGYNNLGDEGVATLASGIAVHGTLSSLDLGFNNMGDEGCVSLASAISPTRGTLHTLYLSGNCIGPTGALALADLIRNGCGLQRLYLTGNNIQPDGARGLLEAITNDEIRRNDVPLLLQDGVKDTAHIHLDISHRPIDMIDRQDRRSMDDLQSQSSEGKSGVRELFLGGTNMGHDGCAGVARLLRHASSLRVLSLANCEIDDDQAKLLADAITQNRERLPLESLQLSFNNLSCKGTELLMNALWTSTTLKELKLDNNLIGDRGASVVSAVLTSVKTLVKLDLGFNSISAFGMRTLMKVVAENSQLNSLSISGNIIDTGSAKAVAYALAYNASLQALFLDHCSIGSEGQRHITAGIVSNSRTHLHTLTGFRIGGKFSVFILKVKCSSHIFFCHFPPSPCYFIVLLAHGTYRKCCFTWSPDSTRKLD